MYEVINIYYPLYTVPPGCGIFTWLVTVVGCWCVTLTLGQIHFAHLLLIWCSSALCGSTVDFVHKLHKWLQISGHTDGPRHKLTGRHWQACGQFSGEVAQLSSRSCRLCRHSLPEYLLLVAAVVHWHVHLSLRSRTASRSTELHVISGKSVPLSPQGSRPSSTSTETLCRVPAAASDRGRHSPGSSRRRRRTRTRPTASMKRGW